MGVYIEGLDMPKKHSLWMVIHSNGQVWMRKRHYCQNLEGVEATEFDLVRCGECKHKMQALSTEKGATGCELIRGTFYEDFFCKEGERRADEHNS